MNEIDESWNSYVQQIASLVDNRESYQKTLGQTASTVVELYGNEALLKLAADVEEVAGRKISPTTLRNYKWVWEKTSLLGLPEDLSYRCLQSIAGSKDPVKYANLVAQGYSSNEIIRLIREDNGLKESGLITCPVCGNQFKNVKKEKLH
jgi:hypothetical protein